MADWVDTFMDLTSNVRSPELFRLWAAIATISSALERRVWTETDVEPLRPNLFVILAGNPASGKGNAIREARKLLANLVEAEVGIHIGPDNPTPASFLDALANSTKKSINGMGIGMYSAITVLCRELGSLITKYESQFVANLADIYDNPPNFSAPRRQSTSVNIEAPTINILAAATPGTLFDIIPETAWNQGLTSRMIFIYGAAPEGHRDVFKKRKDVGTEALAKDLREFYFELHGEFDWEPEARNAWDDWYNVKKMEPKPDYSRLQHYSGRRNEHVLKLAMISAVSAGHGLTVTLSDFRRAQRWLFEAEKFMPDVFTAMVQRSDSQVLEDAHQEAWVRYTDLQRDKRAPLTERDLWKILESKATSERIPYLLKSMLSTGRMRPHGITGLVPAPPREFKLREQEREREREQ